MINQSTIEKILDTADIAEVVGEYVNLKRRGVNLIGNCPFHDEKTPSFVVSPTKGIFKCFGCGKAGNSVGFVMEQNRMSYPEALRWLAEKYQIEIIEEKYEQNEILKQKSDREALLAAYLFASKYFKDNLENSEEGKLIAKSYLAERGIRDDSMVKFELGYCKKGWTDFYDYAIKNGYNPEILENAGLIKQKEKKNETEKDEYFDIYRERIIFPIHDITGRIIAFGARILKKDDKISKYINSPENEVYHKSKVLYGMFQAKKAIREKDFCLLTEGYLDVITLSQNGIENVVASAGTALTHDQVKLISRFTENITMLYDGDKAGINAALKGTDIILENNLNVKIVILPDGEDPDSYCKKTGGAEFENYIQKNETDFIIFKTNFLLKEGQGDPIKKANAIREIVESIAKIPDPIKRSVFIKQTASMLDTDEQILHTECNRIRYKDDEKNFKRANIELENLIDNQETDTEKLYNSDEEREKSVIRSLILYGNLPLQDELLVVKFILEEIEADNLEFLNEVFSKVISETKTFYEANGYIDEYFFKNNMITTQIASDVIIDSQKHLLSPRWLSDAEINVKSETDNYRKEVVNNINYLKFAHLNRLLKANAEKIKITENEEELTELLEIQKNILDVKAKLASIHGIIVH
ncbi:MAG: DNA primase [Bacteroidetes bacterium]|nr:DNA primase [Bacteroidota bacterium]